MGAALPIADQHDALELRALARQEKNGRVSSRMVAIANALDGMTRLAASRSAGMDRQTLRDWVVRYNADGIDGLYDQPKGHTRKSSVTANRLFCWPRFFKVLIPYRTAHAPGRFLIFAISSRRALANGSRHQVCGASFSVLAFPTKRHDRFIQRPIPRPRPTFKKRLSTAFSLAGRSRSIQTGQVTTVEPCHLARKMRRLAAPTVGNRLGRSVTALFRPQCLFTLCVMTRLNGSLLPRQAINQRLGRSSQI